MEKLYWSRLTEGRIVCTKHKGMSDTQVVSDTERALARTVYGSELECETCKFGF